MGLSEHRNSLNSKTRKHLMRILAEAINAVEPRTLVARAFAGSTATTQALRQQLIASRRVYLLAAGKAAVGMALEACKWIGPKLVDTLVIAPAPIGVGDVLSGTPPGFRLMSAAHPIPDGSSETAARSALDFVAEAQNDDLIIFLLSGGASSLLALPGVGLKLDEKVAVVSALMNAGGSIHELNTVRRHLSDIKGGRLLKASRAKVVSLILSDVPGNDLATIGSGPTAADATTYSDAIAILKRRGVWGQTAEAIRDYLERGAAGELNETIKPGDPILARVTNFIIGDNLTAVEAACRIASELGYNVVRGHDLRGEANRLGAALGRFLCEVKDNRTCVIAGGETTVEVKGNGKGGRSQQAALAAGLEMARLGTQRQIAALFAGTDGIDGPTDAAGAIVTPTTVLRGREAGLDAKSALERNDCYNFFRALGDLVIT
jgi:glycerate 2-kinase